MATEEMADANPSTSSSMTFSNTKQKPERLPITVEKPTPYTFDLGHLLAHDPNPLTLPPDASSSTNNHYNKSALNASLAATARDGAQSLINQLLTTCPISSNNQEGVLLTLPQPETVLPRFKPLPTPKAPTKWELFARKKGIGKYNTNLGASEKERRNKMVYDEEKKEWVPRWGYKGKNKAGASGAADDWVVEVPEKEWKKEAEMNSQGKSVRNEGRRERKERIKRNERKMRANEARQRKGKAG